MNPNYLLIGSDNNYQIDGLPETAVVQVTLRDTAAQAVAGQTWPLTLLHSAEAKAHQGVFKSTLELSENEMYRADLLVNGNGLIGRKNQWFRAVKNR
jgi:hypothetical protein